MSEKEAVLTIARGCDVARTRNGTATVAAGPGDPAVPMAPERKAALRRAFEEGLANLDPGSARRAAGRLHERVLELPEVAGARAILTCLSFGSEVDTWGLVERLRSSGKAVYVPRTDRRRGRLHVHPYPCELRTLSFGLRQPPRGAPELAAAKIDGTIDAVLILGLAFDRRGYRLGYGGGYFDRFLAGRPMPAIGLGYDFQLVDELPTEPHDVPMAVVVTDRDLWRPGRRA